MSHFDAIAFVEKQLDLQRRKHQEHLEAAQRSKDRYDGLAEQIEKAKAEGADERFVATLEKRQQARLSENAIAVRNASRLEDQIAENEELLEELRREAKGGEPAGGTAGRNRGAEERT